MRRIDALAAEQLPTQCLVERIAEEIRAAMPVDALIVAATDPDTLLALGAGVVHGMPSAACRSATCRGPRARSLNLL